MTDHEARMDAGAPITLALLFMLAVGLVAYRAVVAYTDAVVVIGKVVGVLVLALVAYIAVSYLFGYLWLDFTDDVRRWLE